MAGWNLFQKFGTKAFLCAIMVVAADRLFYDQSLGWTIGLYGGLILGIVLLTRKNLLKHKQAGVTALAAATLVLNLAYRPDILSTIMYIASIATLLILSKREYITDAALWAKDTWGFVKRIFIQLPLDWLLASRLKKVRGFKLNAVLRYAIVPALLSLIFCCLFSEANPIIARFMRNIDLSFLTPSPRWYFWAATTMIAWSLVRPKFKLSTKKEVPIDGTRGKKLDFWLSKNSLTLSLIVFNILFAIQNSLDIAFIWSGGSLLPEGMTYAEYAHAGAYPLIFTTIIAAIYVLMTFGDNSQEKRGRYARAGVYVWIAQNIFLVFSAVVRLVGYIDTYSLTLLRVAALIWMGLIAIGMILIIGRIYMRKSNLWLTNMNALTLAAVLYCCCFINFNRMVADYNVVQNSNGKGQPLDIEYILALGPDAVPALQVANKEPYAVANLKSRLESQVHKDWRAWTLQRQLLLNEITKNTNADGN